MRCTTTLTIISFALLQLGGFGHVTAIATDGSLAMQGGKKADVRSRTAKDIIPRRPSGFKARSLNKPRAGRPDPRGGQRMASTRSKKSDSPSVQDWGKDEGGAREDPSAGATFAPQSAGGFVFPMVKSGTIVDAGEGIGMSDAGSSSDGSRNVREVVFGSGASSGSAGMSQSSQQNPSTPSPVIQTQHLPHQGPEVQGDSKDGQLNGEPTFGVFNPHAIIGNSRDSPPSTNSSTKGGDIPDKDTPRTPNASEDGVSDGDSSGDGDFHPHTANGNVRPGSGSATRTSTPEGSSGPPEASNGSESNAAESSPVPPPSSSSTPSSMGEDPPIRLALTGLVLPGLQLSLGLREREALEGVDHLRSRSPASLSPNSRHFQGHMRFEGRSRFHKLVRG